MPIESVEILKTRIDKTTLKEATEKALKWAKEEKQRHIITPNPEILLEAQANKQFQEIINKSDLNTPDGIGILWAAKYLKETKHSNSKTSKTLTWIKTLSQILIAPKKLRNPLTERVTGVDLLQEVAKNDQGIKIFLLGAAEGIAEKTKDILEAKNPQLDIVGTYAGSPKESEEKEIINKINKSQAQILFIAYGAPAQEFWINRNLKHLPSVKVAVGIGGAFDFVAQIRKRAPKWMQKTGTEWLYRLIQQPNRIKRIYNATIKFPLSVLKNN